MEQPELEVAGCQIEFVNGDGSYIVTVIYRVRATDTQPEHTWPSTDKFTFSTGAKLKKFISKTLLGAELVEPSGETLEGESEEVVEEVAG